MHECSFKSEGNETAYRQLGQRNEAQYAVNILALRQKRLAYYCFAYTRILRAWC